MTEDNPITRAFAEAAVERLIEQVRRDRERFEALAKETAREGKVRLAVYLAKWTREADATLRAVLGEEP